MTENYGKGIFSKIKVLRTKYEKTIFEETFWNYLEEKIDEFG